MTTPAIDPKYSIGIDEMDAQHAQWIILIDNFHAAAHGHLVDAQGLEAARIALEQLIEYTHSHFRNEEQFIAAHKYPDLEKHQQKHRKIEAEVTRLLDEILAHKTNTTPLKLNMFITIWLMEHIMSEDLHYARFILKKPAA
jgi:hemerythrin-like metal-binding protein